MTPLGWGMVLLTAWLEMADGARILAWIAMPATSHQLTIQPVLRELANRGHTIDFYSAVPMKNPPKTVRNFQLPNALQDSDKNPVDKRALGKLQAPLVSFVMYQVGQAITKKIADSKVFQDLLNSNEKYDLILGEFLFINEEATALMHKFQAPGVCLMPVGDSAWVNELSGLPDNPAYMIDFKSLYTPEEMGFWQRLHNVYITTVTNLVCYLYTVFPKQWTMDEVFKYPGWESRPRLSLLASDFALILSNSHHSVGYPFPKAPHVKEVAGLNIQPNKPLPQDLQAFMDSATDGVIYFSFGSVVDMSELMENGVFDAIHNVFKGLKQKVLWKFSDEKAIPKVTTPNIKFSTWFPQQDILAHKNCKLFITHGGLLSTIEAVNYGVPLIGVAVFGDQPKNLVRMRTAGYGVELSYDNLTETSVSWAIKEVLGNPSYKKEILRRQAIFKDRQMPPVQEAAYWIEYVLKHGKVLQPASAQMPFYKLYLLDVMAFLAVCLLSSLWLLKKASKIVRSLIGGKSKKSVPASKKRQ